MAVHDANLQTPHVLFQGLHVCIAILMDKAAERGRPCWFVYIRSIKRCPLCHHSWQAPSQLHRMMRSLGLKEAAHWKSGHADPKAAAAQSAKPCSNLIVRTRGYPCADVLSPHLGWSNRGPTDSFLLGAAHHWGTAGNSALGWLGIKMLLAFVCDGWWMSFSGAFLIFLWAFGLLGSAFDLWERSSAVDASRACWRTSLLFFLLCAVSERVKSLELKYIREVEDFQLFCGQSGFGCPDTTVWGQWDDDFCICASAGHPETRQHRIIWGHRDWRKTCGFTLLH